MVTGMHVSCVYKLRQALGLDPPGTPVKVVEPYQMLGEIAPDLQDALGVDVVGLGGRESMFGFENKDWKPWTTFDGTPVLVPGGFNTEPEPNGDILMYPEGDRSAPPSGRMPKGGFYFDSIIRQEPIDERSSTSKTTSRSSRPISDDDAAVFRRRGRPAAPRDATGRSWPTSAASAFGDIALVPAPWLKHPKGIRDVAEWYMSTVTRFDYVYELFSPAVRHRPGEPGEDLRCGGRPRVGRVHYRHRFRHAARAVHQPGHAIASSSSRSIAG